MKKSEPSVKTKLIYGAIVIGTIAVIIIVLVKLVEIQEKVAKAVGLHSTFGASLAIILSLVLLLAICYGVGVLVHTQLGALSFNKFEKSVLLQIPGYSIISNILKGFAEEQVESYLPALIQLGQEGTGVLGFVMEKNDNDTITVFVPSVPAITIGSLHIVERKRVTFLEASHLEIVNCITEWGVGSNKFISRIKTD
jgi:uncharacterized membrane protein